MRFEVICLWLVIKTVADVLKESVDKKDSVVRYGGEEFVVILRKNDEDYLFVDFCLYFL